MRAKVEGSGDISTVNGSTQHLVLQANNWNSDWSGTLNVGSGTLVFVKRDRALGKGANLVASGGTLGFRAHVGATLNYNGPTQTIQVSGLGAVRTWGKPAVGAIYHDGGINRFWRDITMTGDTWFGARGDQGGLLLNGEIFSKDYTFTKVGLGMISLGNESNHWGATVIRDGVLRITDPKALSSGNLNLNGGILEIGSDRVFWRDLGTGANQVYWTADGGFSAVGTRREVILNSRALLSWGRDGFLVPVGQRQLLLSSRYANAEITFMNPTNLGRTWWTVRVERGMTIQGYAVIAGAISSTGISNDGIGFYKTGLGLLWLAGEHTYYDKTGIHDGAIGGIPDSSRIEFAGYGPPGSRGGVIALREDFTRTIQQSLGPYVSWHDDAKGGGFAAYGGDHMVRLNNSTSLIYWSSYPFVGIHQTLKFGHYTSDGTILWDKQIGLAFDFVRWGQVNLNRKINVERGIPARAANRADVSFIQAISGTGGSLTIQGDGRMDIAVDNPDLNLTAINIFGAELRLQQQGRIADYATHFYLKNGGTLTLDNLGTHKATIGGQHSADRIHNDSDITLNASTLRYWALPPTNNITDLESVGLITLADGANALDLKTGGEAGALLFAKDLIHATNSVATFDLTYELGKPGSVAITELSWGVTHSINDAGGVSIVPWATVNGEDWVTPMPVVNTYTIPIPLPVSAYHTAPQDTWAAAHNVSLTSTQTLSGARTINSLKIVSRHLVLGGHNLTINSGGLLTYTNGNQIRGSGTLTTGALAAGGTRPLYMHTYGHLTFNEQAVLSVPRLIKTGPASLNFNSTGTHSVGDFYIHQGTVDLQQGSIAATKIVIGDGAGKDIFKLPANRWNPITGKPDVTLRGTPYGPGAEYFSYNPDEAILQMGGNTKQYIGTLRIEDRGTIDWVGGEVGKANMLFVDKLEFIGTDAQLFMRNWYEYEDYLLVKKVGFNFSNLGKIVFDGLWDLPALAVHYDAQYYMITPYNSPEPSTYGAILGGIGLGLWTWQRKRRAATK